MRPARNRKLLVFGLLVYLLGLGYAALVLGITAETGGVERHFGEAKRDDARQLRVYIEVLAIDAVNESMRLRASFAPGPARARSVPLLATVGDQVVGGPVSAANARGSGAAGVLLHFKVRRSTGLRLLVLTIYGQMALIGLAALTISGVTFLGIRPVESTLMGALTGMVFALPVLRYALPGSPPLGVSADLLVFFWAELAVGLALLLFISAWVRPKAPS